jgi:hypothetical protein
VPGRGEEGPGSSKSANERFGGTERGDLDSVEETPGISRQPRRVTIYLFRRLYSNPYQWTGTLVGSDVAPDLFAQRPTLAPDVSSWPNVVMVWAEVAILAGAFEYDFLLAERS